MTKKCYLFLNFYTSHTDDWGLLKHSFCENLFTIYKSGFKVQTKTFPGKKQRQWTLRTEEKIKMLLKYGRKPPLGSLGGSWPSITQAPEDKPIGNHSYFFLDSTLRSATFNFISMTSQGINNVILGSWDNVKPSQFQVTLTYIHITHISMYSLTCISLQFFLERDLESVYGKSLYMFVYTLVVFEFFHV